jgi:hypothetical protein
MYLRTAKLAEHVERNGVWEYHFPDPEHPAVKISFWGGMHDVE